MFSALCELFAYIYINQFDPKNLKRSVVHNVSTCSHIISNSYNKMEKYVELNMNIKFYEHV